MVQRTASLNTKANILLVDDKPANLLALQAILDPLNQNLVSATSGREALGCLLRHDFAVILMDVQMPGMDGFETAALIKKRQRSSTTPIIFVTANNQEQKHVFQGYAAGAVDYIFKPYEPQFLKSKVGVFVELFQKEQKIQRQAELLRKKNEQMETDLELAREIQRAFLPQQYPTLPPSVASQDSALHFCHRYLPTATLGGDFFDVVAISDHEIGIFICDVMGHGVRSALVTAMVRTLVEGLQPLTLDPGKFLTQINGDLLAVLKRMKTPLFASAMYLIADIEKGSLSYANAGHPSPLLIRPQRDEVKPLTLAADSGPALALMEDSSYTTCFCELSPGDLLLLFTDGLFEVEGTSADFDEDRLLAAVSRNIQLPAGPLMDQLLLEIQQFSVSGEFEDDVCLVAMEVTKVNSKAAISATEKPGRRRSTQLN